MIPTIKFFANFIKRGEDDCWLWEGPKDSWGYGQYRENGKAFSAHRIAYEHYTGIIPKGLLVLHSCDTPACVNPKHLRVGTQKENMQDKVQRNRCYDSSGEANGSAKLTAVEVEQIRDLAKCGLFSRSAIGELYSIHRVTVGLIVNYQLWKNT